MPVRGTDDLAALATSFNDMAASLQEKLRELEELSKVQRQFVSDVSHELRTPLTTIRIAADVLFEAKDTCDARSAAVRGTAAGPARAVRGAAGGPAGDQPARRERGHPGRGVRRRVRPGPARRRRRASSSPPGGAPGSSSGCPPSRAWPRWTGAGSSASCATCSTTRSSTARAGTWWSPWRPTGTRWRSRSATTAWASGPAKHQLVFDRFWRADPARARTTGGTGLGLAIALEDARLHGGWLQAWGEPGKGSVFRLTLPARRRPELAGSPLPLGPDDTDVIPSLGEVVSGGLVLGAAAPPPGAVRSDETGPLDQANPVGGTGVGTRG